MKLPHFLALAAVVLAGPALAQDQPGGPETLPTFEQPEPPGKYPAFDATLTPAGEFTFSSDLKDSPGQVSVGRAGMNLTLDAAITQSFRLGLSADVEGSWYNFDGPTTLIPGVADPFNDAYLARISPSSMYHFNSQWAVLGGAIIEFAGEPDADLGESFTGGGFAGVRYAFSETFALTLGAVVKQSLEDDPYVLPLIGIEWQITPTVSLTSAGPGARLTAKVSEQWAFFLQAGYQLREYRLADDAPLASGVVRDRRIPIAVGVTWSPSKRFDITLRGGATAWQEFELDNSAGNEVSKVRTKPAPFIGLSADFKF